MCEEIKFIRTCPNCGKEITYARKSDYNKAVKKGSVCKSCAAVYLKLDTTLMTLLREETV